MTPTNFIGGFIRGHEGVLSMRPDDNGNWFDPARFKAKLPQRRNMGVLVGSKFGITAYALATYRKIANVTAAMMAALTINEAIDIGFANYYLAPHFDRLPWDRVTASILDKAWGSGPGTVIRLVQRMIGVNEVDGVLGDGTASAYKAWRNARTEEQAARDWATIRLTFDHGLATNEGPNDPDKVFEPGWDNRTKSFLPGTPWWASWSAAA